MRKHTNISSSDAYIDSRDVIARIDELEAKIEEAKDSEDECIDEEEELKNLKELEEQAKSSADWKYGETLIREDEFTNYAEEFAKDIGATQNDSNDWPNRHIDWEAAAEELKMDYMEVEFDGEIYLIRA